MSGKIEVTFENGHITALKVGGKDKMKRDLLKAMTTRYWKQEDAGIASNPFSGEEIELTALEMTIYKFCQRWYSRYSTGSNIEVPLATYDWMKYLLLEINSNAYMTLLD